MTNDKQSDMVRMLRDVASLIEDGEVTIQEANYNPVVEERTYPDTIETKKGCVGHRIEIQVSNTND